LKNNALSKRYEKELINTADLFRKKLMMRRWRRSYLNVSVAKNSFELSYEINDRNAPSINELMSFTKQKYTKGNISGSYI